MDMVECLMKIGFTKHEAVLYLTLCKKGELTGYEASKISGIPRSNTYLALAGLVEKGGAYKIDGDPVNYAAVMPSELTANTRRQINEIIGYIEANVPVNTEENHPFITIAGKTHILNKLKNVIDQAGQRIYLSMTPEELENIKAELTCAVERGLKVVIITSPGFVLDGAVIYFNDKKPGQIRLIADTSHVITGEISGENKSTCLYSRNKNLVELIKDSLTNEIKLIDITRSST